MDDVATFGGVPEELLQTVRLIHAASELESRRLFANSEKYLDQMDRAIAQAIVAKEGLNSDPLELLKQLPEQ